MLSGFVLERGAPGKDAGRARAAQQSPSAAVPARPAPEPARPARQTETAQAEWDSF